MESTMNNGMCRCCASEGTFKDVKSTYHWMGEEEVYSEMLKECFDIALCTNLDGDDGGICEVCITQLRNAVNFKKQVLHTEEQFKERLQTKLFSDNIVKVELGHGSEIESDNDNDHEASGDLSDTEYEVPIKTEDDEPKARKRAAKPSTSKAKRAKKSDGETSKRNTSQIITKDESKFTSAKSLKTADLFWTRRITRDTSTDTIDIKSKLSFEPKEITLKFAKDAKVAPKVVSPKSKRSTKTQGKSDFAVGSVQQRVAKRLAEIEHHLDNLRTILYNSNATPIKGMSGLDYCCCFCEEKFRDPADLKTHTLENHVGSYKTFMQEYSILDFMVKLDITGLKCTECSLEINGNLKELMDHLQLHYKYIHTDIKNHFVPFRFVDGIIPCVFCSAEHVHFKAALVHIREHYDNYICDQCNAGCVTYQQLRMHVKRHNVTGEEHKCKFCPKVFNTLCKVRDHERVTHIRSEKIAKCVFCDERFCSHGQKITHMMKVHDYKPTQLRCKACDMTFVTQSLFREHTKKFHLMEKNHECGTCSKKFFNTKILKNHLLTHTDVRDHQCVYCSKSFARKYSLTQHLRIHLNDRKFKCPYCDLTFIQKCSWKGHLLRQHNITATEYFDHPGRSTQSDSESELGDELKYQFEKSELESD